MTHHNLVELFLEREKGKLYYSGWGLPIHCVMTHCNMQYTFLYWVKNLRGRGDANADVLHYFVMPFCCLLLGNVLARSTFIVMKSCSCDCLFLFIHRLIESRASVSIADITWQELELEVMAARGESTFGRISVLNALTIGADVAKRRKTERGSGKRAKNGDE